MENLTTGLFMSEVKFQTSNEAAGSTYLLGHHRIILMSGKERVQFFRCVDVHYMQLDIFL